MLIKYIDQSPLRKIKTYSWLEPWHPDIAEFINLNKHRQTDEEKKEHLTDLYNAFAMSEIIMEDITLLSTLPVQSAPES